MNRVTFEDGRWSNADEDRVEIVEYDPRWPEEFEREASAIRVALAAFEPLTVEHFGSTAIPDLAAKPIIDIMLVVRDQACWPDLVPPLQALGYSYWAEDPRPDQMFFVKGMPPFGEKRTHHVHVYLPAEAERRCAFRDYLIAHPDEAARYAALKRDLTQRFATDRERYTHAKGEFIAQALRKA